ncbi:MAG TPA: PQQ-dependent sugar dehydrogenase, partial [Vicinamibacterales bacterium]|nr:PQQ-dependent sugar dehydrogenase [Vicinamibacterales bacterium]
MKSVVIAAALAGATLQPPAAPQPPAVPATLAVPTGFTAGVFASGLIGARLMAVSPEGTLLVARRPGNEVVALPDHDGAAHQRVILSNLPNAHSLAFKDGWLYIATTPAVVRVRWSNGAPVGEPETVVELPSSTPSLHVSRTINFGPDGRLYVAIGSSCNVCVEADPRRTTIQVVTKDGTLQPYARGLHNAIGFDWDAQTGRMWAGETAQDNLGDDFPPDEIDLIEAGAHYGFPFFIGANRLNVGQPELEGKTPGVTAADVRPPALELPAHISPIDMRFYTGTAFPAAYRHALFIALHGSARKTNGYRVARVVMKDGRPTGIEDFATGFLKDGVVAGRPAGLA